MTTFIQLKGIEYNVSERKILTIPELTIEKGVTYGIMGPNGAGKSTLLKILSLLDSPSKGTIFFNNQKINPHHITLEQRRTIAIALQQSLLLNTSVFNNIALGLKIRKVPRREIKQKVNHWLDTFHISHLSDKHASQLSGGEAQRVNLARAMILEPELLCLDEPFSALDFPTKMQLIHEFKSILSTTGTTAIFVSHDLFEIKSLTDQLYILMNGKIKQSGKTSEVIQHPNEEASSFINEWKSLLPT